MTGRHPFRNLTKDLTPARRARIEARKAALRAEMPLHELRRARELTQQELARTLGVNQPAIAKMERRADMYVSNLRAFVEAMGGRLRIVAEFPEGDVDIANFGALDAERPESEGRRRSS